MRIASSGAGKLSTPLTHGLQSCSVTVRAAGQEEGPMRLVLCFFLSCVFVPGFVACDGDGDGDEHCERPQIGTDHLGEDCGGDGGLECLEGQQCSPMTPSVPDPIEVCLIGCNDDCDCPSGMVCLFREPMPGSPSPHCGEPQ